MNEILTLLMLALLVLPLIGAARRIRNLPRRSAEDPAQEEDET